MTTTGHGGEGLAGSIDLYRHLVRAGPVDVDRLPGTQAAELRALGLATVRGGWLAPVAPATAMAHVLAARQRETVVRQEALRRAYQDLTRLHDALTSRPDAAGGAAWQALSTSEAAELADRLRRTARRELLEVWTAAQTLTAGSPALATTGAVPHRMVVDRRVTHNPRGEQAVLALRQHVAVRLAAGVTACLRVIDGQHVLVWPLRDGYAGDIGTGATYVDSPATAAAIGGLFEVLWSGASAAARTTRPEELTAAQWRILRLMATGMSDAALAAATGATVKTVRSHITAILRALAVPTRFAAGAEAARKGWF
jgi:DNA-binding CsgD family transcriptional regulator